MHFPASPVGLQDTAYLCRFQRRSDQATQMMAAPVHVLKKITRQKPAEMLLVCNNVPACEERHNATYFL